MVSREKCPEMLNAVSRIVNHGRYPSNTFGIVTNTERPAGLGDRAIPAKTAPREDPRNAERSPPRCCRSRYDR